MISEIDLNEQVLALAEKLKAANIKIVTAESCTGGGLSYMLTNIPGSSNQDLTPNFSRNVNIEICSHILYY